MPGQREIDIKNVLHLVDEMSSGRWDDARSALQIPGVIRNPNGTSTIVGGHHRHIA